MKPPRVKVRVLAGTAASAMLVAACTGGSDGNSGGPDGAVGSAGQETTRPTEPSGDLVVRIYSGLGTTDPFQDSSTPGWQVLRHVYEPLVTMDENLLPSPMLAESWQVSDDNMEYTFTLRKGVLFHDGSEMTADDVKYSFDYFLENGAFATNLSYVESVDVVDDSTVIVELSRPAGSFLADLANPLHTPPIVPEGSADNDGLATEPVGTGPFKYESFELNTRAVLTAFEEYSTLDSDATGLGGMKEPLVETIEWVLMADDQAALAAIQTGEVDVSIRMPEQEIERIDALPDVDVLVTPGTNYIGLDLQLDAPWVDNLKMRQAILTGLDTTEMLETSHFGYGRLTHSFQPPEVAWYDEEAAEYWPYEYSPERAAELAEEAGYDGTPIPILVGVPTYQERNAIIMQQQLAEAGINVTVDKKDRTTFFADINSGNLSLSSQGGPLRSTPDSFYKIYYCGDGVQVRYAYCNPEYDEIYDRAAQEIDPEERYAGFAELERILKDDAAIMPLYFNDVIFAVNQRVHGFEGNQFEWARFWNVWVG